MSPACHDCRSLSRQTRCDVLRAVALSLFGLAMPQPSRAAFTSAERRS
jgi:hypothetical protein